MELLTLGEVETIEDALGVTIEKVFTGDGMPSAKTIRVLAGVLRRREDPAVTDDQLNAMPYIEAVELFGKLTTALEEADPKESPANGDDTSRTVTD